jgi:hypothetical protein
MIMMGRLRDEAVERLYHLQNYQVGVPKIEATWDRAEVADNPPSAETIRTVALVVAHQVDRIALPRILVAHTYLLNRKTDTPPSKPLHAAIRNIIVQDLSRYLQQVIAVVTAEEEAS